MLHLFNIFTKIIFFKKKSVFVVGLPSIMMNTTSVTYSSFDAMFAVLRNTERKISLRVSCPMTRFDIFFMREVLVKGRGCRDFNISLEKNV